MATAKTETKQEQATLEPEAEEVELGGYEGDFDVSDRAGGTGQKIVDYYGIAQRQTDKAELLGKPGKFYWKNNEGEYEFADQLEVIILESSLRGVRFENGAAVCRSYNGRSGPEGQECKQCEYYQFRENNVPTDKKCKGSIALLCIYADDWTREPFVLQIPACGIREYRDYASMLQNRHSRPIFSAITRITTRDEKFDRGRAFVPVFKPIKAINDKEQIHQVRNIRIVESYRLRAPEDFEPAPADNGPARPDDDPHPADTGERDPFQDE